MKELVDLTNNSKAERELVGKLMNRFAKRGASGTPKKQSSAAVSTPKTVESSAAPAGQLSPRALRSLLRSAVAPTVSARPLDPTVKRLFTGLPWEGMSCWLDTQVELLHTLSLYGLQIPPLESTSTVQDCQLKGSLWLALHCLPLRYLPDADPIKEEKNGTGHAWQSITKR